MKLTSLKISALASALILAGCGGSSTTDPVIMDDSSHNSLSKISGTVPGTLIEAFCEDGSYYKVTSTDNNTNEHPFEIEIPSTMSCSLVMTTNENDEATKVITQIGIITTNDQGTFFTASGDVDLGNIPLAMDPSEIHDANGDHVSDDILSIQVDGNSIVIELESPLDDDNDGLVNVYEDDDNDGIHNHDDEDDDGDGEIDIDDDSDDDGIDDEDDVDDNNDGHADITLPTVYTADAGRLLGSQCAQCHGTNGISTNEWESIAGENFEHKTYSEEIMNAQAIGYTEDEKQEINNWFKTLKTHD